MLNATATVRALAVNLDDFSMIRADPLLVTIVPTHVLTVANALGGDAGPGRGGRILRNNTGTPFERTEERLLTGTSLDLTAVADPGWTFLRWAGDASGTAAQTSVVMDRSRSVQAVFGTTLATSAVGPGAIQISPSPGPYTYGQVVRLYPKPALGAAFSLWGGAGSGSATPLDFTVTAPGATVSALFTSLGTGQVNLSWEAVGNGVVTVSPQKSFYAANETVTVTAVPGPNQVFTGWSGALSGMENPAAVTLSTSKAVTANFQQGVVVSVTSPSRNVVPAGGSLTLSATVTGTPAPTLQWFRNGRPIAGATNASLVISDASALYDAGWYQLRASNQFGIVAGETRFVIVGPGEAAQIKAWGAGSGGDFPQGGHADLISVSSGTDHGIALKRDGTVVAWGNNGFGKATVPIGLRDVVGVAAAGWHNLALKGDGTVAAWGHNYAGETSVPEGLSQVVAIAAGWIFSVALKQDGSIVVWGEGSYRQKAVPADLVNVVAVAAGSYHGLALKQDGTVTGWGWNSYGEVNVPADLRNVVAIAAGASHSLALRSDGSVVGWGRNDDGQSTPPSGLTDVVAVTAGAAHSVALKRDGTVVAWGQTTSGQGAVPAGMARVVALAAGGNQTLALRDTATDSTPLIVSQPTPNVAAAKGQYAVLAVQASAGAAPMAFQWRRNGVTLPNATNAEYRVEVDEGTVGTYTVQVSNYLGSVTSEPAIVALRQSPLISLTQGGRVVVTRGSSTAIEIDPALLTPGRTVQWTRNGRPLVLSLIHI